MPSCIGGSIGFLSDFSSAQTISIALKPCELLRKNEPEKTNRVGLSLLLFVQSERVSPFVQKGNHREPTPERYGARDVIARTPTAKLPSANSVGNSKSEPEVLPINFADPTVEPRELSLALKPRPRPSPCSLELFERVKELRGVVK